MHTVTTIKALLQKDLYVKYGPIVDGLDNLEKEYKQITKVIGKYYQHYTEKPAISSDELQTYFYYLNPAAPKGGMYGDIFKKLESVKVDNPELLVDILNQEVERHYMTKVASLSTEVVMEQRPTAIKEIRELCDSCENITNNIKDIENDVFHPTIEDLEDDGDTAGLKWRLPFFTEAFGPLPVSTLGHLFGRPDAGKTSIAIAEAVYFTRQLSQGDQIVLYLNNEESIKSIWKRCISNMLNVPTSWIYDNRIKAVEAYDKYLGDHIKLIPGVQYLDQVERYIEAFRPRVVFIDQGPKLSIQGDELKDVKRLQKLYNRYRSLASEYECSIITTGQADNAASNQRYLTLNNLDSSKVAIPGELDWCVGVGYVENDPTLEEIRFLRVAKNKLMGRYPRQDVHFDNKCCRFDSLEEEEI